MTDRSEPHRIDYRFKCMSCGLHFQIHTDLELRDDSDEPATTWIERFDAYCPECGQQGRSMVWREEQTDFIFQAVPGMADLVALGPRKLGDPIEEKS